MQLPLSAPIAMALAFWSCLGCGLLSLCGSRTDAALYVALVVLLGQFAIAGVLSARRRGR